MPEDIVTAEDVLAQYVVEKNKIREFHNMEPTDTHAFKSRVRHAWAKPMQKAADNINAMCLDAPLWVEACFAYARSKGHMDGPLPNCLGSLKYATAALGMHLNLPSCVVQDFSKATLIESRGKAFKKNASYLKAFDMKDPVIVQTLTSIPAIDRWLCCCCDSSMTELLINDVMECYESNRVTAMWADSLGYTFEQLAKIKDGFNN